MSTPYDIVLYGATGFTGRQCAEHFAAHADGLKWAIAGRNRTKLGALASRVNPTGIIVADSTDPASVDAMVAQGRVLCTTAGPFAKYGTPVVEACVAHGVDYVDITGETPWVRDLIDRFHDAAALGGTRIVPFCGFDSVPSDLGALYVVDHLRTRGTATRRVSGSFTMKGGFNGGTLDSALTMAESGDGRRMADPVLLNPRDNQTKAERKRSRDLRRVIFDPDRQVWLTPFIMAQVNTRVVRRSNALFMAYEGESAYGPEFSYHEAMEMKGKAKAYGVGLGLAGFEKLLAKDWGRALLRRIGPDPGEGPTDAAMDGGFTRIRLVGTGEDGHKVLATLQSQGDPGNRVTVKILCESALMLAQTKRSDLPGGPSRGGVLTPATALGLGLLDRLQTVGFELSIRDL
jgi:short subunit dehydrogenase-like uncharacterized protein